MVRGLKRRSRGAISFRALRNSRQSTAAIDHPRRPSCPVETVPGNRTIGPGHRYQRHQPGHTPLYSFVERHLPTLRDELQHRESSLPRFVLNEFQDYLRCGRLEYGFVRVKCNGCRHEHLVAGSSRSELLS